MGGIYSPLFSIVIKMANEFVVRNGLKVLDVPSGSTSEQIVVYNTVSKQLERKDSSKSGSVASNLFSGAPRTYTVTFSSPYPNTNYSVVITGGDARAWTTENLTVNGFTINTNSNTSLTSTTNWIASMNV